MSIYFSYIVDESYEKDIPVNIESSLQRKHQVMKSIGHILTIYIEDVTDASFVLHYQSKFSYMSFIEPYIKMAVFD